MSWHPVDAAAALVPQLAAPASAVPVRVSGVPLVLTRDTAGTLHALSNECPHQAAAVCRVPQRGKAFLECPNHYWVFDLDGTFRGSRLALERGRTAAGDPVKNLREHPCRESEGLVEVDL